MKSGSKADKSTRRERCGTDLFSRQEDSAFITVTRARCDVLFPVSLVALLFIPEPTDGVGSLKQAECSL